MTHLAKQILLTAKLLEESWDDEAHKYSLSIEEAAQKAYDTQFFFKDATIALIALLLVACWNDALSWAERVNGVRI